jgi:tripartite-type tricarboxylate transporter receptor subunit TctC
MIAPGRSQGWRIAAALFFALLCGAAFAQSYPNKPIRLILPFPPVATPRDIISRLSRDTMKALEAPDARERMAAAGIDPWPGTPEQMGELLKSETARFAVIVRSAGLTPE